MAIEYITDEELSNMSEEEVLAWLEELDEMEETAAKRMEKDGFKSPKLSLADIDNAYKAPEFQGFLDKMGEVDYPSLVFEDKDDVETIKNAYEKVSKLSKNASLDDKEKAYMPLYAAFYPYMRRVNPLWGEGADRLSRWERLQDDFRTVYTLNSKTSEAFKNLVSPEDFARIDKNDVYTLGAVRFREGQKTAAGVLMFTVFAPEDKYDEAVARIDWLYVAEGFRGNHVADDLMAAMYNTLNRSGIKAVTCHVPVADLLPLMVCDFLSAWSINFSLEPFEDFDSTIGEIAANKKLEGDISKKVKMRSLKELGIAEYSKVVYEVMRQKGEKNYKLEGKDTLEPDLSILSEDSNGGMAFLMVDKTASGMLKIRQMSGNPLSRKILLDMLKYAIRQAQLKYEPQTKVFAQISTNAATKLLDYMFPDHGLPMHLVGANLSPEEDISTEMFDYFRYKYEQEKQNPQ